MKQEIIDVCGVPIRLVVIEGVEGVILTDARTWDAAVALVLDRVVDGLQIETTFVEDQKP